MTVCNNMHLRIAFKSGRPLYLQLVDQVRQGIASGLWRVGTPLPTIRPLAQRLHLNRNTVAKAYAMLESLGFVKTIPGKGSFVKEMNTPFTKQVRQQLLTAKIDDAIVAAHQLRIDSSDFLALSRERLRFFTAATQALPQEEPEIEAIHTTKKSPTASAPTAPDTLAAKDEPDAPKNAGRNFVGTSESWSPASD